MIAFFKKLLGFKYRLAILVPYRDREAHLAEFIPYMKEFLPKRHPNLIFQIYIIEQTPEKLFNRGKLMNIGYTIAKENCDYICFHDVDMLPEDSSCNYSYSSHPTQLATYLDRWGYREVLGSWVVQKSYWGGVTIIPNDCYQIANGFSNDYWGWGPEDKDLHDRCIKQGLTFKRRLGRYRCLDHKRTDKASPSVRKNADLLQTRLHGDICKEGLSNLEYTVLEEKTLEPDVFFITVDL